MELTFIKTGDFVREGVLGCAYQKVRFGEVKYEMQLGIGAFTALQSIRRTAGYPTLVPFLTTHFIQSLVDLLL